MKKPPQVGRRVLYRNMHLYLHGELIKILFAYCAASLLVGKFMEVGKGE